MKAAQSAGQGKSAADAGAAGGAGQASAAQSPGSGASSNIAALAGQRRPRGLPFDIRKIGHVVLNVSDVVRSTRFYVDILGFEVSDIYPQDMVPGGMVFMRCNADHHGVALVGGRRAAPGNSDLHHLAFEVASLDEVVRARDHLRRHAVPIDFEGRRRAGCQIAVEFRDPDGHRLEIYWGLDQVGSDGRSRPKEQWNWTHSLRGAIDEPVDGQDTTLHDGTLEP
jgi:catechol 2,3-dioxygenase-like lactoylglutathione lyase family enzyme